MKVKNKKKTGRFAGKLFTEDDPVWMSHLAGRWIVQHAFNTPISKPAGTAQASDLKENVTSIVMLSIVKLY